jgi:rod shape-determining protein MreD
MAQTFLFGILILLLTVLSRVWVETISFISWGPDFALLFLVYFAAFHNPQRGLLLAFTLGLVNDVLTGVHPGLHATIYTVIFWIMSRAGQSFYLRSVLFQLVAAASATIGYRLIELLILTVFEQPGTVRVELLWAIPAQVAINTAVAPFVFKLLAWAEDIATPSLMRGGPSPNQYW